MSAPASRAVCRPTRGSTRKVTRRSSATTRHSSHRRTPGSARGPTAATTSPVRLADSTRALHRTTRLKAHRITRGGVRRSGPIGPLLPLIPDLFLQQLSVAQLDLTATQPQRAATLQIHEHAVDGDARRTDEGGEVLLRERHDAAVAAQLVLIDEAFRHAPGKIEEDEILDVTGAPPDPPREQR